MQISQSSSSQPNGPTAFSQASSSSNNSNNVQSSSNISFIPAATNTQTHSEENNETQQPADIFASLSQIIKTILATLNPPTEVQNTPSTEMNTKPEINETPAVPSEVEPAEVETQTARPFEIRRPGKADERVVLTTPQAVTEYLESKDKTAPENPEDILVSGYSFDEQTNTERFVVLEGEPKKRNPNLDPRVERPFLGTDNRISTDGSADYEFNAHFNIETAKKTTFLQMLNDDPTELLKENPADRDRYRPILFLEAFPFELKDENGELVLDEHGKPLIDPEKADQLIITNGRGDGPIYEGPREFDLKVETNGQRARITISPTVPDENGNPIEPTVIETVFDRYADNETKQNEIRNPSDNPEDDNDLDTVAEEFEGIQQGSHSILRYGAYHHDGKGLEPKASTANISVTGATLKKFTDEASTFPKLTEEELNTLQLTPEELAEQEASERARLAVA